MFSFVLKKASGEKDLKKKNQIRRYETVWDIIPSFLCLQK